MQSIGTCGNCGGRVEWPTMMVNAVARCVVCGAVPRDAYGPVIPMGPSPKPTTGACVLPNMFTTNNTTRAKP